jgi:hypothetical protein
MKKLLAVLAICSASYALNAPYLISATALSDSSVSLSWRNNDAGTVGYLVQRKDSTETVYQFIDSVKIAAQLTYTDLKSLQPLTLYTYQVIAYDATVLSDTSNSVQVTTLALTEIFKAPVISIAWHGDTSTSVKISIVDSSNVETGYRIYREESFSSVFNLIFDTISKTPKNIGGTIIKMDNTVSFNTWYRYRVAVYKSNDSLFSATSTAYTFHYTPQQPQNIIRFHNLSDFPISTDSSCWSARAGDSIILRETNAPIGTPFTVINVSNPANPVFAGYIDSATAKAYPIQTLIPVFLNYKVRNSYTNTRVISYGGDRMLIGGDSIVRMYQVVGSNLVLTDSITVNISTGSVNLSLLMLNDSLLGFQHRRSIPSPYYSYYFYTYYLTSSGFSPKISEYGMTVFMSGMSPCTYNDSRRPYIHGFTDQNLFTSFDYLHYSNCESPKYTSSTNQIIHNIPNNQSFSYTENQQGSNPPTIVNVPYVNTYNTGYRLSLTKDLCTNGFPLGTYSPGNSATEIFASEIKDPRPHVTDSLNNAIYRDAVHLQNQLRNILLDTLNKRVYLVFNNNVSILGYYDSSTVGVISHTNKRCSSKKLTILPNVHSGVTIVLPAYMRSADVFFYDLTGRVIDKMSGVTSSAVLWRPKTRTMSCYIVMVRSGSEKYTAKFMVR